MAEEQGGGSDQLGTNSTQEDNALATNAPVRLGLIGVGGMARHHIGVMLPPGRLPDHGALRHRAPRRSRRHAESIHSFSTSSRPPITTSCSVAATWTPC